MACETYESKCKRLQRAAVVECAEEDVEGRPIVYLDGPSGAATLHFLDCLPKRRLVPVNHDADACRAIEQRTGVTAVCADVYDYLIERHRLGKRYAAVWIDGTGTLLDADGVSAALEMAPYVFLVLSYRGIDPDDAKEYAKSVVAGAGGRFLEEPHIYQGRSGSLNMIKMSCEPAHDEEDESRWMRSDPCEPTPTKRKVSFEEPVTPCGPKRQKRRVPHDSRHTHLVGRSIHLPQSLFRNSTDLCEWEHKVRTKGNAFVFKVSRVKGDRVFVTAEPRRGVAPFPEEAWPFTVKYVKGCLARASA